MLPGWAIAFMVLVPLVTLIAGIAMGVYFTQKKVKTELKNNPPINEAQIRAMYRQMGRTPSDTQIKQVMAQFKQHANDK